MINNEAALIDARNSYRRAIDGWLTAIQREEFLVLTARTTADLDTWRASLRQQEKTRNAMESARSEYENAFRQMLYGF